MNSDSAADRRLSAVNEQAQVDTNAMKIGTAHTGGMTAAGAKLIAGSDCLGCHKEDVKLVGPAYKDVAAKYPATDANIAMLANRVITGGKGHWGEIPMSAHPALSLGDAKEMTKYILSLK
ncbi:c-type cytochrome [Hymenobacter sp. UV11]|nr:c-type cytochrome [Hymenobacter sp. UV11]